VSSEISVQAWLSYRCKDDVAILKRDELKSLCQTNGIRLVYDESDTEEGDDLIAFMNDLTSARCVFIFLAPNYFESAYTLFELICIHERGDLDKRFVLPMRLQNDMVTYAWTDAKKLWEGSDKVRNELLRLLKKHWRVDYDSDEALWARIDAAWNSIIFPYLDTLRKSLEEGGDETPLADRMADLARQMQQAINESDARLQSRVSEECERILKQGYIPLPDLVSGLKLSTSSETEVSECMATDLTIDDVLDALLKLSHKLERDSAMQKERWEKYLQDIEQLCGWLLLRTVDNIWWFQQEPAFTNVLRENIATEFILEEPSYIEVIISRNLLQQAQFTVDQYGDLIPVSETHDVMLFDAVSESASDIELLTPIYKDLRRSAEAPQNVQKLIKGIERTVKALSGSRDGKPVYYLITRGYFDLLKTKDWYEQLNNALSGYLHFAACRSPEKDYESNPCSGDLEQILEKVALLLRLKNAKEESNA
jgi:hypothetical protein